MAALQMKWSAKQQTRQASSLPSRYNSDPMTELLNQIVAYRSGALVVLSVAALLEALGDSCFQSGLYRSSGMVRAIWLAGGALALACYGLAVNAPRWEFGSSWVSMWFSSSWLLRSSPRLDSSSRLRLLCCWVDRSLCWAG